MSITIDLRYLSCAVLVLGACHATLAAAQTQERFNTRAPRTCAEVRGVPDNAQAVALIQCHQEGIRTRDILLLENVTVQIGAAQPYNSRNPLTAADTASRVYPIRGSFRRYSCDVVQVIPAINSDNRGKNCSYIDKTSAEGYCWRTTFSTWDCNMDETTHNDPVLNQPPP